MLACDVYIIDQLIEGKTNVKSHFHHVARCFSRASRQCFLDKILS